MERDEERPDAEPEEESGRREAPSGSPAPSRRKARPAAQEQPRESRDYTQIAVISAAAVVLGVVLFVAGFLTASLLDDDLDPVKKDLDTLTEQTGAIQKALGLASAAPTPAPVVEASADDDPFLGPEDAPVTIIEFSDYQ